MTYSGNFLSELQPPVQFSADLCCLFVNVVQLWEKV